MHRCLYIPEVLVLIIRELRHLARLQRKLRARCDSSVLGPLARTCKAFNEPAISVLWEELPSLSPVLGLLPEDLLVSLDDKVVSAVTAPQVIEL